MAEETTEWQTPKEIRTTLGDKKCRALIEDLAYDRKSRPEILEAVVGLARCNVYSAEDFLRDLLKNPLPEG